jgi:hypothetical protein
VKLPPPKPVEQRYAVAIRDGSDLWLTLWVRCSPAGGVFVMLPRREPDWDVHVSYHHDGKFHTKTLPPSRGYHDRPISRAKRQPLTAAFKGIEHLANLATVKARERSVTQRHLTGWSTSSPAYWIAQNPTQALLRSILWNLATN